MHSFFTTLALLVMVGQLVPCTAVDFRCYRDSSWRVPLSAFETLHSNVQSPHLKLDLFGTMVELSLTRDQEKFASKTNFSSSVSLSGVDYYHGTVVGFTKSSAWVSRSNVVKTAIVGGMYFPHNHLTLSIQPGTDTEAEVTCHTNEDSALFHPNDDSYSHNHKTAERARRDGPHSSSHNICPVFLDIDTTFYERWGGSGSDSDRLTTTAMVAASLLQQVSALYEDQLSVTLALAGIYVRPNPANPIPTSGGGELGQYEAWLVPGSSRAAAANSRPRGDSLPTAQSSCLNLLLVNRNLAGTLGTANMAVAAGGYVGGVCETYLWKDSPSEYHALNTGIITSQGRNRLLSTTELVSVMAHEVGHLFGAPHSCTTSCSSRYNNCNPSPSNGGPYLMYPSLQNGQNSRTFSPCSLSTIREVIQNKAHCFVDSPPTAVGVFAGTTATTPATTTVTLGGVIHGCTIEPDTDYLGNNLGVGTAFPSSIAGVVSQVQHCAQNCQSVSSCAGFSVDQDKCYLKSSTVGRRSFSATSGICRNPLTQAPTAPVMSPTQSGDVVTEHVSNVYTLLGLGCCRTVSGSGTFLITTAASLSLCQAGCSLDTSCLAVEYQQSSGRCELHTEVVSHVATSNVCTCYLRTILQDPPTTTAPTDVWYPTAEPSTGVPSCQPTRSPTESTVMPRTDSPSYSPTGAPTTQPVVLSGDYTLIGHGCCRTADDGPGLYTTVSATSLLQCQQECDSVIGCVGVEYQQKSNVCEVHTMPITHVALMQICVCYSRTLLQPSVPPSTPPTVSILTMYPTVVPTIHPTSQPSVTQSRAPSTPHPTPTPTRVPSKPSPTSAPSRSSTSLVPTESPTAHPTFAPSPLPSPVPTTTSPTPTPTGIPTTRVPTQQPTISPTPSPSATPSRAPTTSSPDMPSTSPPTAIPTTHPTSIPSRSPTTFSSTIQPTLHPTSGSEGTIDTPNSTIIIGNLGLHPSGVYFENMFPDHTRQFSSTFTGESWAFTENGISLNDCFDLCVESSVCAGFSWWIGEGGNLKCRGLTFLGVHGGYQATKSNMTCYSRVGMVSMHTATTQRPTEDTVPTSVACASALCGADCSVLNGCGWSTGHGECRAGGRTTSAEMSAGHCGSESTIVPPEDVVFVNAFPLGSAQYSTVFETSARVFTVTGTVTPDECFELCGSTRNCAGFAWWVGDGGTSKCRGMHDLGTPEGRPITKTGMISYRKNTTLVGLSSTIVPTTAAAQAVCATATCGATCTLLPGCGWSRNKAACRSGARTTTSELSLGVCT
eukprot:m.59734 g.59734  ORF g.59734 m.59734 type:complete len:1276 (+) comp9477_c0_seq1:172-3999(+)